MTASVPDMWNDTSSRPEISLSRFDVVGDDRVIGAEHRAEVAHARGAALDALLVEVVAEDVDAVGAGQVVEAVAVEIGDGDAGGRLHEGAGVQVLAHEAAVLERHAVGAGELQVGDAFLDLRREPDRLGEALPVERRQAHEAGAALARDLLRARRRSERTAPRRIRRTGPAPRAGAPCANGRRASGAWPSTAPAGGRASASRSPAPRRRARRQPKWSWPIPSNRGIPGTFTAFMTVRSMKSSHDGSSRRTLRTSIPADQPHSAPAGDAVHGLVQPDRAAAGARSVDRRLADVLRPRPGRGGQDRLQQPARLLHPRAQGRRAADRSATRVLVSPCDAIVGACGAIAGTELLQAKGFPYTLQDLLGDPELVGLTATAATSRCG